MTWVRHWFASAEVRQDPLQLPIPTQPTIRRGSDISFPRPDSILIQRLSGPRSFWVMVSQYSDSDGPIQTLGFICEQPLPKQVYVYEPEKPSNFRVSPYLAVFKEALDIYQVNNPSQTNLPNVVTVYPDLVNHVYEQFQDTFSEKLSRQASPINQILWERREQCVGGTQGSSYHTFGDLFGRLVTRVCNQLDMDEDEFPEDSGWPFYHCDRLMFYGAIMLRAEDLDRKSYRDLLAIELIAADTLSIISEICAWARDGRHLDYDLYKVVPDTVDSPQMTIQKVCRTYNCLHIPQFFFSRFKADKCYVSRYQ